MEFGDLLTYVITKVPNEFTDGGNISEGVNTFPGVDLSSDTYDCGIQYNTILPDRGRK